MTQITNLSSEVVAHILSLATALGTGHAITSRVTRRWRIINQSNHSSVLNIMQHSGRYHGTSSLMAELRDSYPEHISDPDLSYTLKARCITLGGPFIPTPDCFALFNVATALEQLFQIQALKNSWPPIANQLKGVIPANELPSTFNPDADAIDTLLNDPTYTLCFQLVTTLNLSSRNLRVLPDAMSRFSQVQVLNLSNNPLTALSGWIRQLLPQLTGLHLSNNRFSSFPEEIQESPELNTLILSGNRLETLPNGIKLPQLKTLVLSGNRLASLPDEMEAPQIESLDLSDNQLSSLPNWIGECPKLEKLYCKNNQLGSLPDCMGLLTGLKSLYLSHNEITSIPVWIGQLTGLTMLDFSHNQLNPVPDEIGQLTALKELNLAQRNKLTVSVAIRQRLSGTRIYLK